MKYRLNCVIADLKLIAEAILEPVHLVFTAIVVFIVWALMHLLRIIQHA